MRLSQKTYRAFFLTSMLVFGQQLLAQDTTMSREQANAFFEIHQGRWCGTVQSTIGEAEVSKVDEEALNYIDFDYVKDNGLLVLRTYGPRGGGRGTYHYDSIKKLIRAINHGVGGVVTHHEIVRTGKDWARTSTQVLPDGATREFKSTIKIFDNNQAIKVEIHQLKDGKVISTQTNVWRRIE